MARSMCTVDGCNKSTVGRGWCRMHYMRWNRTGTTDDPESLTPEQRFWTLVDRDGPKHPSLGKCWLWKASTKDGEYGGFKINGKTVFAHRFAWTLLHGEIPDGMCVLHRCDRPTCVRADSHLFLGTPALNSADMTNKERQARGEQQGSAKLTDAEVLNIRRLWRGNGGPYTQVELAAMFDTYQGNISAIILGKNWKHLPLHPDKP